MPGAEEFCTRTPQLEGEEVFLSLKRKVDVPIGSEFDSHRPDMISISRPRVQTRSARNNVLNLNASPVELADSPQALEKLDVPLQVPEPTPAAALNHVTSVQETACDESQWHIARLPKTSAKACFAYQAVSLSLRRSASLESYKTENLPLLLRTKA